MTNSGNATGTVSGSGNSRATGGTSTATGGAGGASSSRIANAGNSSATNAGNTQSITVNVQTAPASGASNAAASAARQAASAAQEAAQSAATAASTPAHMTETIKSAPQIAAPALTTTLTETCMGSSSAGLSLLSFGLTAGTSWHDEDCIRRLNARELAQTLGDREVAKEVLCGDRRVWLAYQAVGRPCRTRPDGRPNPAWHEPAPSAQGALGPGVGKKDGEEAGAETSARAQTAGPPKAEGSSGAGGR